MSGTTLVQNIAFAEVISSGFQQFIIDHRNRTFKISQPQGVKSGYGVHRRRFRNLFESTERKQHHKLVYYIHTNQKATKEFNQTDKESTQILSTFSIIEFRRSSTIYPNTQKEQQYSSKKSGRNNQCYKNSLVQILVMNYSNNLRNSCVLTNNT